MEPITIKDSNGIQFGKDLVVPSKRSKMIFFTRKKVKVRNNFLSYKRVLATISEKKLIVTWKRMGNIKFELNFYFQICVAVEEINRPTRSEGGITHTHTHTLYIEKLTLKFKEPCICPKLHILPYCLLTNEN